MKVFFAKLKAACKGLAFWRKRKPAAPQPDQSMVIEKPSAEELAAAAAPAPEKPGFIARLKAQLKALLRRKPLLEEAPAEAATDSPTPDAKISSSVAADEENPAAETAREEPAKLDLRRRLLGVLGRKWVWIPSVSILLLALIGGSVAWLNQQSAHDKAALQAELEKTKQLLKKQLQHQAEQPKTQAQVAAETAKLASNQTGSVAVQANRENKPGKDPGDCVITTKESVAASLKNCIDSFNSGSYKTTRKAP